jgi:hypothetical protein
MHGTMDGEYSFVFPILQKLARQASTMSVFSSLTACYGGQFRMGSTSWISVRSYAHANGSLIIAQ